jgi:hypothetical protein
MSDDPTRKKAVKIKLEVSEKLEGGRYSNVALVNNSDSEFVIDGFFLQPQKPVAKHATRMVLSPRAAKRLYMLLGDRLKKYEAMFGEMNVQQGPPAGEMN